MNVEKVKAEMKRSPPVRTVCEVLRDINDLHQEQTEHDKKVRVMLMDAEDMCKRMSEQLYKYNKKIFAGWWKRNPDFEKKLKNRLSERYCIG